MRLRHLLYAGALTLVASAAMAQYLAPAADRAIAWVNGTGTATFVTPTNPLPVTAGLASTSSAIKPIQASAASSLVVKAASGVLYAFTAINSTGSQAWVEVFNAASAPSNGATTPGTSSGNIVLCRELPSGSATSPSQFTYGSAGEPPISFSTGITIMVSSTNCATLTAATTQWLDAKAN